MGHLTSFILNNVNYVIEYVTESVRGSEIRKDYSGWSKGLTQVLICVTQTVT